MHRLWVFPQPVHFYEYIIAKYNEKSQEIIHFHAKIRNKQKENATAK